MSLDNVPEQDKENLALLRQLVDYRNHTPLTQEQIESLLQPEEVSDEGVVYQNAMREYIKYKLEKGDIDPALLSEHFLKNEIVGASCFLHSSYDLVVKEYCEQKGIDCKQYMAERQQSFEQQSSAPESSIYDHINKDSFPSEICTLYKFSQRFDFKNSLPLSDEVREEKLTLEEETGPLGNTKNISRKILAENLKLGIIDPNLLTQEVFDYLINVSGVLNYAVIERIYCVQNGLDYDKYTAERKDIIMQNFESTFSEIWPFAINSIPNFKFLSLDEQHRQLARFQSEFDSAKAYYNPETSKPLSVDEIKTKLGAIDKPNSSSSREDLNRFNIKIDLECGNLDPNILTDTLLEKMIFSGSIPWNYQALTAAYCHENNIPYDKYTFNKETFRDPSAAQTPTPTPVAETHEPALVEKTQPLEPSAVEPFVADAAQVADKTPAIKQNWMHLAKTWFKEKIYQPIQKFFGRDSGKDEK